MDIKLCRHVKVDGTLCQVPPLDGRHYCHFHLESLGRRMRMARARASREPYHLVLPILEDLNAVQVARMQVMDALNAGHIDAKQAGLLLYGLQGISGDLRSAVPPRLGVYDPAIDTAPRATEAPGFEQQYGLPQDLDLSQPPEVVFPPAEEPVVVSSAPPLDPEAAERQEKYRMVTAVEVELEQLREQDRKAYARRLRELDRADNVRRQREERKLVQARSLVEADRRNQATEQRMKEDFRAWEEQQYGPRTEDAAAECEPGKKPATASGDETDSTAEQKEKSGAWPPAVARIELLRR